MRRLALACLLLTIAGTAPAQHYDDFDACGYDWGLNGVNGLRVYFDASVATGCAGILADPGYFAWSATNLVEAYLVLTHPTATILQNWQCDFSITGDGVVQAATYFGDQAANLGSGDTHQVFLGTPLPLASTHVPLARFDLQLFIGGNPQPGQDYGLMEFHLGPAGGGTQPTPGYVDGDGVFMPCASFTSPYHGWDPPCMLLNDSFGVTDTEPAAWGSVKALYR